MRSTQTFSAPVSGARTQHIDISGTASSRSLLCRALCVAITAAALALPARSQIVWENTGTSFNTAGNWVDGVAPGVNDVAVFNAATATNNPALTGSRSVKGIEFASGTAAWTFSGTNGGSNEVLTIGSSGIVNNSSNTQTFTGPSSDLTIQLGTAAAFTSNGSGTMSFLSSLTSINNGGFTLTLNGTSTNTNIISEVITGSGGLTKSGTGTWRLGANNSYTGVTTISGGVLELTNPNNAGSTGNLGNTSSAASNLVLDGGTLRSVAGGNDATNRLFTLTENGGAIENSSGGTFNINATGTVATTGDGNRTLTLGGAQTGNNYFKAILADPTVGKTSLTKDGAGVWILSGANTYTGATTINAGTLRLGGHDRISDSSAVTVASGGIFDLYQYNETVGSLAGAGSVRTTSSNRTFTVGGDNTSTTFSGVLDDTGTSTLNFVKTGSGTLALTGANTYAGTTTISGGTLQIGSGGTTGSLASTAGITNNANLTFNRSDALTVSNAIGGTGTLTQAGTGTLTLDGPSTFTGAVSINSGTLAARSSGALGAGSATTTVANGATLSLANNITIAKGSLSLTGTGSGSGALVNTSDVNTWNGNITLTGNTTINVASGSLYLGEDSSINNNYPSHTNITPTDTHTVALGSNTLTLAGGGSGTLLQVNSRITGTGNVTIDNAGGDVIFYPYMNSYTGTTSINAGTLEIQTLDNQEPGNPNQGGFYGINGPVVIGDGSGSALTATLKLGNYGGYVANEVLNFTSPITLKSDGRFLVESVQTINALTFNGGTVDIPTAGGLYLDATVTVATGSGVTSYINTDGTGQLSLSRHFGNGGGTNADRIFNVFDATGNSNSDLSISAQIVAGSMTKNEAGTMTINGTVNNTYEGTTTINNGILNIQKNEALGGHDNDDISGTTVNGNGTTNGTLQLQGGITVTAEKLTLNNTGFQNRGALENLSGNNTWTGSVVLQTDSRITSTADLLTLSGTISSTSNSNLDVYGAGNTTLSGSIGTGSGGINKHESGKLILSGNDLLAPNTYGGDTNIYAGVLSAQKNSALGNAGSTTTVHGGALELDSSANGNLTLAEPSIFLNGFGISNGGALRNVRGDNTVTGIVTVASATRINSDLYSGSATTLTLQGGITGSNAAALTVGGAGNTVVSGPVSNTNGSLTWDGSGSLTLSGNISNGTGSLLKNGTGNMTFSGTTGTVGQTRINAGTMIVGTGSSTTLNTAEFSSASGTTLLIASGGTVNAHYNDGLTTNFAGVFDASSAGTFAATGTTGSALAFTNSFTATDLTLQIGGTAGNAFRLELAGVDINVGTLHITGDTILDFNNSANTFLRSATLIIDAGVNVTVEGWASLTTVWYATNTIQGVGNQPGVGTQYGTGVLGNITFGNHNGYNYDGLTTTWVNGTPNGWLDREIRPTPEPATYGAIFVSSCLGLLGWRRYRGRKSIRA